MPTERTRRAAALCLAYALLFSWVLRPLWDIDVFLHVAIGREIAAHGIPSRDVFSSATPDAAYTPFQVGYELLVAKLDALGGIELVRVIDAALCAGAMLLLLVRLRQLTGSRAATFALFALFLLLYDDRIRPRPHLCNLWFEVALLLPLASARFAVGNRRHWLTLFALGALWSTLHAMGALWLLAVLGCFVVAGDEAQRRWAFGAAACALAGILLAPGALGGILHVLRIQDQWREFVPELAPTWAFLSMHDSYGYAIAILPWAAALSVVYAAAQAPAREHWPRLLCAAGFAWSGLWLARLCYYAVFAVLLVWPMLATSRAARLPGLPRLAAAISCACALILVAHVAPRFVIGNGHSVNPWTTTLYPGAFPVAEAGALARTKRSYRVYNDMTWGGYLLYRLYPKARVISDGRVTFTAEVAELIRHERSEPLPVVAEVAAQRFGIDTVVVRRGRMQPTRSWQLVLRGPVAEVWLRNPAAAPVMPAP